MHDNIRFYQVLSREIKKNHESCKIKVFKIILSIEFSCSFKWFFMIISRSSKVQNLQSKTDIEDNVWYYIMVQKLQFISIAKVTKRNSLHFHFLYNFDSYHFQKKFPSFSLIPYQKHIWIYLENKKPSVAILQLENSTCNFLVPAPFTHASSLLHLITIFLNLSETSFHYKCPCAHS